MIRAGEWKSETGCEFCQTPKATDFDFIDDYKEIYGSILPFWNDTK